MRLRYLYGIVLISYVSLAGGILNNNCYSVSADGTLKRLGSAIGCFDGGSTQFDQKSAGGGVGVGSFYKIQIVDSKIKGSFSVFEANYGSDIMDLNMSSRLITTAISDGKVLDQTTCLRNLEKPAIPFVKKDQLTCVTVNKQFCEYFFQRTKKNQDLDVNSKDISECADIITKQMDAMNSAISDSWKDKSYHELAKNRFDETKKYTDQYVPKKLEGLARNSYNLSDSDPTSGTRSIRGIRDGYDWMQTMFNTCNTYFSNPKSSSSSKKVDTTQATQ